MENKDNEVPDEFKNVMSDFIRDILTTFPEYNESLSKYDLENDEDIGELYKYCSEVYPERFFDLLYKNEEMFKDDDINLYFLPDVNFKDIWSANISDNTRDIIWKYLQLIVFSISKSLDSANMFGDTQKMFEAIDENELREKLEKTIDEMSSMFDMSGMDISGMDMSGLDMSGVMPDASELHKHLNNLLDGKLGRLAAEIAEETANDLDIDLSNNENMMNVFQNLFKNPEKLMGMIKKVGDKLDEKIKSGEIKESEIMSEASDLMNKMKNMSGMKEMNKMFSKMGVPGMGKSGLNMGAMQSRMKENLGKAKQRERMLKKLEERRAQKLQLEKEKQNNLENVKFVKKVYSKDEEVKKSSVKDKMKNKNKKKNKKKKKNKNKK